MKRRKRDPFFDNARLVLIFLVVLGHLIEPLIYQGTALMAVFKTIYLFHMPAFVMLVGYFAKKQEGTPEYGKLATKVLIPYLLLDTTLDLIVSWPRFIFTPLKLSWTTWFLVCYFLWYLMLPAFRRLKYPLATSILLTLIIGTVAEIGKYLSLSRALYYMPFFLFGYYANKKMFEKREPGTFIFGATIFGIILSYNYLSNYDPSWLFGMDSYRFFGLDNWSGIGLRLLTLMLSLATSCIFLRMIPLAKASLTKLGQNSFYVYLYHPVILTFLLHTDYYRRFGQVKGYPVIVLTAAVLTLVLSAEKVAIFTRKIIWLEGFPRAVAWLKRNLLAPRS